ncbi:MAG: porin [Rhodocyclales bacterium]|nr:porin [Rhodocyclales bacterium]
MQKKLIALAIAGLSGAAFAQSNVTVYGAADASFDFIRVSGGAVGADTPNYNRVSSNGSHIGFKGMESLGNGMVAVFQYETAVNLDGGGASSALLGFSRDSYVGLAGGFGTVIMGSASGPTRNLANAMDVNTNHDGITSNRAILGKLGGAWAGLNVNNVADLAPTGSNPLAVLGVPGVNHSQVRSGNGASVFDQYLPNVIAYVSPNFSGFQATIGYVAGENKSDAVGTKVNTSAVDLGLTYSNGPIWVGLTHGDIQVRNQDGGAALTLAGALAPLGNDIRTKETRLGGKYDFGNATVRLMWSQNKSDTSLGDIAKQTVWGIGGTFNVTANGKITGQYYRANDLKDGFLAASDTGAKFFTLGYEHSLSKRTSLNAAYAHLKNDTNAIGYDFGNNSTGLAAGDVKLTGLQLGLRHSF